MANHKSAEKRARQSLKRRGRNRAVRTRVRGAIKDVRTAIEQNDAEAAQSALAIAVPLIDKAAGKGVLHNNNAARKISRLTKSVSAVKA